MAITRSRLGDWSCGACGVRFHHKTSLVRHCKIVLRKGDTLHRSVPRDSWATRVSTTPAHLVLPVPPRNKYELAAAGPLALVAAPPTAVGAAGIALPPGAWLPASEIIGNGFVAAPLYLPPLPPMPLPPLPVPAFVMPILPSAVTPVPVAHLRSSRTTRNQDHNQSARNRAGVIDHDPTDGLPVRRWVQEKVSINQDAQNELTDINDPSKQDETDFPWPELPLPSFFTQLAPVNQALIRRSRMGDRNVKPSVWDRDTEQWIPQQQAEAQAKQQALKSKYLMNLDTEEHDDNEEDVSSDSDNDDENIPPTHTNGGLTLKKRKITTTAGISDERIFEAKKWVSVPLEKADSIPEPKYLADRRTGMQSLYTSAYKSTNGYGMIGYGGDGTMYANAAGYDLGDGSGLGNALGGNNPGLVQDQGTPVRKNMPPKRKKKKLGGPGRKKANPNPEALTNTAEAQNTNDVEMSGTADNHAENGNESKAEDAADMDSEGEGSEEGEIEENNGHEDQPDAAAIHVPTPTPQPLPTSNDPAPDATTTTAIVSGIPDEVSVSKEPEPQPAEPKPEAIEQNSPRPSAVTITTPPAKENETGAVAAIEIQEEEQEENKGEDVEKEVDLLESLEASIDGQGQQQAAVAEDAIIIEEKPSDA